MNTHEFTVRLRFIIFLILLAGLGLITRIYFVTIVHGDEYREAADNQYRRGTGVLFDRGSILLSAKDESTVRGATLATGFTVAINPSVIENPEGTFEALSLYIPLDEATFMTKAGRDNDTYEEVANRVSKDVREKIGSAAIEGVTMSEERWRTYAAGDFAAHVLGFVGWEGDQLSGRYGLEKYYDQILRRDADPREKTFFAELFEKERDAVEMSLSDKPGEIVVSIEPSVQIEVEKTLDAINESWHPDETGIIVLDPKTGEVFGMGALPSFNPNTYNEVSDPSVFKNPMVENVYEMGSIVKPLTMALGLDAGVVTPDSTYNDKGFLDLDDKTIRNFDGRGRGVVSMQEVLNQSLNTGVAHVALLLGFDEFSAGMKRFGLGEETGIDLPSESAGLTDNLNVNRDINIGTASFGQGIALTPIMTIRALAALGNGGVLINPHLIKEIRYTDGSVRRPDYSSNTRVLKKETSETITRMLVEVVDDALLHGNAKLIRYHVAAKTGTAQIAHPEGGYYTDRYLHSFFGYFPAYDPKFLVFLYAVNPKGATYSSETLTVPFMDMARFLVSYYNVPPTR